MRTLRSRRTRITRRMMRTRRGGGGGRGVRVGVGAGICPELEPEISKMGGSGNPAKKFAHHSISAGYFC